VQLAFHEPITGYYATDHAGLIIDVAGPTAQVDANGSCSRGAMNCLSASAVDAPNIRTEAAYRTSPGRCCRPRQIGSYALVALQNTERSSFMDGTTSLG
jgi:hypothetical protein